MVLADPLLQAGPPQFLAQRVAGARNRELDAVSVEMVEGIGQRPGARVVDVAHPECVEHDKARGPAG